MRAGGLVGIAVAAVLLVCGTRAVASAPSGGVYISTLPADADVWIDGTYVGRSPVVAEGLESGRHTLTVTKAGWTSQELPIDVPADSLAMTGVRLTSNGTKTTGSTGIFVIRKIPAGAQVAIDGRPAVADPHGVVLPAGLHRLTMTFARGPAFAENIVIYPDTATALALLDAAPVSEHAAVIAQASDFLPDGSYNVSGGRFTVHYGGHDVIGTIGVAAMRFDGVTVAYDSVPAIIGGRLYLPLAFLEKLTGHSAKPK